MSVGAPGKTAIKEAKPRILPGLTEKDGLIRHPFDLEFGVRTSGLVAGRNLGSGHRNDRHFTAYYAVAPSVFQDMIVRWRRCRPGAPCAHRRIYPHRRWRRHGPRKLLASEYPFRAVVGVEIHPTLARIGRRNMALWRAAGRALAPMRMHCRDAAEFPFPPGPCVAFLFNPFGAPVLRRLLRAWRPESCRMPGQMDILYVNNEQESVLQREPGFARIFLGQVRRSQADAMADRKILKRQPGREYAAPGGRIARLSMDGHDCPTSAYGGGPVYSKHHDGACAPFKGLRFKLFDG